MKSVKVIEVQSLAIGVFILKMEKPFDFLPGQLINIWINDYPPRIYSIASASTDNFLAVIFEEKPDGKVTPLLKSLKQGDYLKISGPFGNFTDNGLPSYWIANGTGIAPFYSMVKSGIFENKMLIHGGRTLQSFYFQDELIPLFGEKYIRCCSAESNPGIYTGRLTTFLKSMENLPVDYKYYLCGSAEMVVDVRDILLSRGIPYHQVLAEIYF
jgi:ferredoxin--NADP+ reductase